MKTQNFFLLALLSGWLFSGFGTKDLVQIYVSADGTEAADGTIANPYGSLPKAIAAVMKLRNTGNESSALIDLREGRHQLHETLVLGLEDGNLCSGEPIKSDEPGLGSISDSAYLTIAAYPGESPVVRAGVPVTGCQSAPADLSDLPESAKGKFWVADIPNGLDKFYTLYDEKGRLNRARAVCFVPTKAGDKKTLYFPEGKLKNWDNLKDVELNLSPGRAWMINMLPLDSVDEKNGVAKIGVSATYDIGPLAGWVHTEDGNSAWIENTIDGLDKPGEWVINSLTLKIYLWPANPAADGSPQGILAPTTSELIRVGEKIDYEGLDDQPVRGITFSGITFSYADSRVWTSDEDQLGWGMQHDWDMFDRPTAMLGFRGAKNCQLIDCKFLQSGGSGVYFDLYAQRNKVESCEFANLGEAGILLAGYGPGTKDVNHHSEIVNNQIHHFSQITWHSPGIWAWQGGYNRIANNYNHHSGYEAVLVITRVMPSKKKIGEGGMTVRNNEIEPEDLVGKRAGYESWLAREKYNHSRHNLFENNEITHSEQKLSDGNVIYVSGTGAGNIVRYNYIHDNLEHSFPSAIPCDDDQNGTLIFGNILYNNYRFESQIASKGTNDVINNFIFNPQCVSHWSYISFESVPVPDSKVSHNIVISNPEGGKANSERMRPGYTPGPKLVDTKMDSNLYHHPGDPNWMNEHFAMMRAVKLEQASLVGDPMFIDPVKGNFGFKEGSPALKLGIEPLVISKMELNKN